MRSRRPTDEQRTAVFDPTGRAPRREGLITPTEVAPLPAIPVAGPGAAAEELATPAEVTAAHERSEPIRVYSMKAAHGASDRRAEDRAAPAPPRVKLRALSEVSRRQDTPAGGLGYFAPPRDARAVRRRQLRDLALWGSVVVIVGSVVTLGVWFLAGG